MVVEAPGQHLRSLRKEVLVRDSEFTGADPLLRQRSQTVGFAREVAREMQDLTPFFRPWTLEAIGHSELSSVAVA